MKMEGIYLDYNSTTPTAPEVVEAMRPFFTENFSNPSNLHTFGRRAAGPAAAAREKVAELLGAGSPEEIVFTGGGSEADNLALKGIVFPRLGDGGHLITSAVEHPPVKITQRGRAWISVATCRRAVSIASRASSPATQSSLPTPGPA